MTRAEAAAVRSRRGQHRLSDMPDLATRAARPLSSVPRPFLKWAGSKQRLLPEILPALPGSFERYFEPFLGSGALFFLLRPHRAILSDSCAALIGVYGAIADDVDKVLTHLDGLDPLDEEMYYRIRAERPRSLHRRAAIFLYLNKACWNGLYRVNSRGEFNVPYGAPKSDCMPDEANLRACARLLRRSGVRPRVGDFEVAVKTAGDGDLVFFDPPYVTGHNNNGFIDYNETLFSWSDQVRLAVIAGQLAERGAHVIVTNAYHDKVLALYNGFHVRPVDRKSTLAGDKTRRRVVTEAVISTVRPVEGT